MTDGTRSLATRRERTTQMLWRVAQYVALAVLLVLMLGLVYQPDLSLTILWNVLIPLVPASLLISPTLWRGVCPVATLNMSANGLINRKRVSGSLLSYSYLIGIGLLALLVPARRFLFNENATALAGTVVVIGIVALMLGAMFDAKAGFCSTLCPILPVERLYGQRPLVNLSNPRCPTCTHCTSRGCIDLSPNKSLAQIFGRDRLTFNWLTSGFGIFAASFPGFIVGYFTTENTGIASAWRVYLNVLLWSLASYMLFITIIRIGRIKRTTATLLMAGTAAALYYWLAAPGIAEAVGNDAVSPVIRTAGVGLVAVWAVKRR